MAIPTQPVISVVGTLPIGVVVDGKRHNDFEVRSAIVQDNIDAVTEVGTANPVELSAAIFARQLVKLGTLTREQINTALIRGMHIADFNAIERGVGEAEKKALLGGSNLPGGQPAEQPLPATESPSTTP